MYDVIIIGSGPAGFTAAIYTARANLKTLMLGGSSWGGQLMLTSVVENFPGFPEGINGPDLMIAMRKQAEKHGVEFLEKNFTQGDFSKRPFILSTSGGESYQSKSVIIATGADAKMLDIPGEKEFLGRGVSTCAVCDAAFFKEKNVIVVGGGDTAMEDSIFLTHFAKSVKIIHRREEFRASDIMLDRAKKNSKIKFLTNTQAKEVLGSQKVEAVRLLNNQTKKEWEAPIDGFFLAIGYIPNSGTLSGIDKDERGYIKVYEHTRTNIEGVFVAGDVHDSHYKQAITAAGFGCMAAMETEKWLESIPHQSS